MPSRREEEGTVDERFGGQGGFVKRSVWPGRKRLPSKARKPFACVARGVGFDSEKGYRSRRRIGLQAGVGAAHSGNSERRIRDAV